MSQGLVLDGGMPRYLQVGGVGGVEPADDHHEVNVHGGVGLLVHQLRHRVLPLLHTAESFPQPAP